MAANLWRSLERHLNHGHQMAGVGKAAALHVLRIFMEEQEAAGRTEIRLGVRRPVGALGRRLVAVERVSAWEYSEPLDAALPGRQVGQAIKAETGLRTPYSW